MSKSKWSSQRRWTNSTFQSQIETLPPCSLNLFIISYPQPHFFASVKGQQYLLCKTTLRMRWHDGSHRIRFLIACQLLKTSIGGMAWGWPTLKSNFKLKSMFYSYLDKLSGTKMFKLSACMFVVYMCVNVCTSTYAESRRRHGMFSLSISPVETRFLTGTGNKLAARKPQQTSSPWSLQLWGCRHTWLFLFASMSTGNLNFSPHVCSAGAFAYWAIS